MAIGQELLNVPMGDMIREMAMAIADAQIDLDGSSIRVAEMMSGSVLIRDENGEPMLDDEGKLTYDDTTVSFQTVNAEGAVERADLSMLELGFSPTFYQFIDTIIEVKIAITIGRKSDRATREREGSAQFGWKQRKRGTKFQVNTSSVDATYSSKYSYSAEGSSLIRTKLSPVPPPAILEERIRTLIEATQSVGEVDQGSGDTGGDTGGTG